MTDEMPPASVRVDRWLWAVRIFKTRAQATHACRMSQVSINGQAVKPSRLVRADDVLAVEKESITRTLRVVDTVERRVGAKLAGEYLEDCTSPEIWEKARAAREQMRSNRVYESDEGGRPRKRDRRRMEAFEGQDQGQENSSDSS